MSLFIKFSRIVILCGLIFLTACTPKINVIENSDPNWQKYKTIQAKLSEIQQFTLKGKVGVKTGSEGGSARINWSIIDSPFTQDVELYGPFGGGRVIIKSDNKQSVLKDAKGNTQTGKDTESLLAQRLGWRIPFQKLRAWAKGMPADAGDRIILDQQGLLSQTANKIWTVEYDQYQQVGAYTLPRKLVIESQPGVMQFYDEDGEFLSDQISIKVIIQSWQDL